jgi:hypothetical protein
MDITTNFVLFFSLQGWSLTGFAGKAGEQYLRAADLKKNGNMDIRTNFDLYIYI